MTWSPPAACEEIPMTAPQQHFRTCHLCEAMCGVVIEHAQGEILSIKGDKDDPFSRGHICPKAVALKDLQEDPDRIRRPLRRVGSEWVEISWDEAYAEIEQQLKRIRREHGHDAVGIYVGNPTAHNAGAMLMLAPLLASLNTRNRFSATSVDQLANMLANYKMFGHQALFPIPDLDRTDFLLMLGANPAASNGSLMSAGDPMKRIKGISDRGGRVLLIDPRRTESADKIAEHWFIRPGTDVFLLAAFVHVLFAENLVNLRHLEDMTDGVAELRQVLAGFTPASVAAITGIGADHIRQLARDFAAAERAVCYGRIGTSVQEFGGLSTWLIYCINILTGNLDREGGAMFTHPAIDIVGLSAGVAALRGTYDTYRSRVRNLPEFGGELPVAALAEEIWMPGPGQIRALITHAGNPVLSTPNGKQVEQALASLEFMVAIDIYLNETTRHANIILPPTGPLEHGHYDIALNAVAVRNITRYSPPLFDAPPDSRHDWQILLELLVRLNSRNPFERGLWRGMQVILERMGLEGMLDWLISMGPKGYKLGVLSRADKLLNEFLLSGKLYQGAKRALSGWVDKRVGLQSLLGATALFSHQQQGLTLKKLKEHPHGLDLGPLQPSFPARLCTEGKRIALVPAEYVGDLTRARQRLEEGLDPDSLLLIGRRHVRSNNSWLHNSHRLVKGKTRCTVMIHPDDAARLHIDDGAAVRVASGVGVIELPAEITTDIMPGVVSVPHGFGHHRSGTQLGVASEAAGVSVNDITDEQVVDKLTGVAVLNGLPVTVAPVRARRKRVDVVTVSE
jgi:anaerobic selenocysteine-containing dehydrogenase